MPSSENSQQQLEIEVRRGRPGRRVSGDVKPRRLETDINRETDRANQGSLSRIGCQTTEQLLNLRPQSITPEKSQITTPLKTGTHF